MNAPKSIATTHATRNATMIGACSVSGRAFLPHSTRRMPAIAIAAPTLISCPPEAAVTSVMPIARIASSEPLLIMSMIKPDSTGLPALLYPIVILKKEGSTIKLKTANSNSAAIGIKH